MKRKIKYVLLKSLIILGVTLNPIFTFSQKVEWVSSTPQQKFVKNSGLTLNKKANGMVTASIFPSQTKQTIDGWGGCFNELGWDAINKLDTIQRKSVLKSLFSPIEGLKLNICRMPVGANDYARDWYSLNETPGDFTMKNFNIERDKQTLIPYINAAKKFQPDLKIWASPWSPPQWMKTNQHYANSVGSHNNLTLDREVPINTDQFIQDPRYLSAYALYLKKFVEAYKQQGIGIYALQFQNEPFTFNQWPNTSWKPSSMGNFIANYLGPEFEEYTPKTELWLGTWNTDKMANFDMVLNSPARKYIAGIGLQWEAKKIVNKLNEKYPNIKLMQTESECGKGDFDWKDANHTFSSIKKYIDGGTSIYTYWNMVLADKGTSSWGWDQNALIRINSATKEVTYTPEFYMFKHFSAYVLPGSKNVVNNGDPEMVTFITPQNELVIVVSNKTALSKKVQLQINDKFLTANLEASSFNTFKVKL
jgi:glucosylceramidase